VNKLCTIEGCGLPFSAKGLCRLHYQRQYHSDPIRKEKLKLQQRQIHKQWYLKNKDKKLQYNAEWYKAHPEAVKIKDRKRQEKYPWKIASKSALRRATILHATPLWLDRNQKRQIRMIYKNCPRGFHVDHIIPLKGENVRGLHVPWNLQYLPAIINIAKGNKHG
jgi:hypothetical protein